MTLYENLEEYCLNYVNYWNANEELEDIGAYNKELREMIDESINDIERTIQQIREEEKCGDVWMSRYSFEVTKEAIMLFDNDEGVVMPVTFEQIAILLNFQDKEIKQLKGDVDDW